MSDDLLGPEHWPSTSDTERNALVLNPERPAVHTLFGHLENLMDSPYARDVEATQFRAIDTLDALPPESRLGDHGTKAATDAITDLVTALENTLSDTAIPDEPVKQLLGAIRNPEHLARDLRFAVFDFVQRVIQERTGAGTDVAHMTFSLILFRAHDHGGAIRKSFNEERGRWLDSLRPIPGSDKVDNHLAIVAPSEAIQGIERLAELFGVQNRIPCVVFLGHSLPVLGGRQLGNLIEGNLACFPIKSSLTYPEQLKAIYRTVYARGALLPGETITAVADAIIYHIKLSALLRLLSGAVFGPSGPKAVKSAEKLLGIGAK